MSEQSFYEVRPEILERDGDQCRFCGITGEQHEAEHGMGLDVHHVIPRAADGDNSKANLLTVCRSCHKTLECTQGDLIKEIHNKAETLEDELERREKRIDELEEGIRALGKRANVKVHIVHETRLTSSRLLYAGTDEDDAVEAFRESEYNATLETTNVYSDEHTNDVPDSIAEELHG